MPLEHRKIEFSNAELQAALVNYCLRHNIRLPDAFIAAIDLEWQPEVKASFRFSDLKDASRTISLKKPEIAAALIDYCHTHRMPLPHHAAKVLEASGEDSIAILIRYVWGDLREKPDKAPETPDKG